eukprot:4048576-Pyramimonas_sp.AAC.1
MLEAEPTGALHQPRLVWNFSGSPRSWTWSHDSRPAQTSRRRSMHPPMNLAPWHVVRCCVMRRCAMP